MNATGHIVIDGKLLPLDRCAEQIAWLAETNHTYRTLHTLAHRPLHPATQLELLSLAYRALFRRELHLEMDTLCENIASLLYRANAPAGSNTVRIAAAPDPATGEPRIFILYEGPLVYSGYRIWHKSVTARPLTYEVPFPAFKTSAGRLCHTFARSFARGEGFDEAITVDYGGYAVSMGDNPLFCISGNGVWVADAEKQSPQSVERLLGIEICTAAHLAITEKALPADSLGEMDEIFAVTPQGIIPVGAVDKKLYASTRVKTFEKYLEILAAREFL
ncbi:MAG: aminotransferase class IV [Rikenellaceae bacterium]|nr:aminotransferase class IV [Rikenellaceae bacterium]